MKENELREQLDVATRHAVDCAAMLPICHHANLPSYVDDLVRATAEVARLCALVNLCASLTANEARP